MSYFNVNGNITPQDDTDIESSNNQTPITDGGIDKLEHPIFHKTLHPIDVWREWYGKNEEVIKKYSIKETTRELDLKDENDDEESINKNKNCLRFKSFYEYTDSLNQKVVWKPYLTGEERLELDNQLRVFMKGHIGFRPKPYQCIGSSPTEPLTIEQNKNNGRSNSLPTSSLANSASVMFASSIAKPKPTLQEEHNSVNVKKEQQLQCFNYNYESSSSSKCFGNGKGTGNSADNYNTITRSKSSGQLYNNNGVSQQLEIVGEEQNSNSFNQYGLSGEDNITIRNQLNLHMIKRENSYDLLVPSNIIGNNNRISKQPATISRKRSKYSIKSTASNASSPMSIISTGGFPPITNSNTNTNTNSKPIITTTTNTAGSLYFSNNNSLNNFPISNYSEQEINEQSPTSSIENWSQANSPPTCYSTYNSTVEETINDNYGDSFHCCTSKPITSVNVKLERDSNSITNVNSNSNSIDLTSYPITSYNNSSYQMNNNDDQSIEMAQLGTERNSISLMSVNNDLYSLSINNNTRNDSLNSLNSLHAQQGENLKGLESNSSNSISGTNMNNLNIENQNQVMNLNYAPITINNLSHNNNGTYYYQNQAQIQNDNQNSDTFNVNINDNEPILKFNHIIHHQELSASPSTVGYNYRYTNSFC